MPVWYGTISVLIGFLQVVDGLHLWQRRGHPSAFALLFSAVEFIWGAISCRMLYALWSEPGSRLWLPALFVAYLTIATVWIIYEYKDEDPESMAIQASPNIVCAGIAFGAVFFLCSVYFVNSSPA